MVDDALGCVTFSDTFPLSAVVEMSVTVSGAPLTGTVLVDNEP